MAGPGSPAVRQAGARLDAALRELEDRGLLWWDRGTNTYDLHPVVRAYVHEHLEAGDRVRANDRIRDHFQALPPEDGDQATSVEDLHQTITLFRALTGAGHAEDAQQLWRDRLSAPLLVDLGANTTVIELLTPHAAAGPTNLRADLVIALDSAGRPQDALRVETAILTDLLLSAPREPWVTGDVADRGQAGSLSARGPDELDDLDEARIIVSLSRLDMIYGGLGEEISSCRCLDLRYELAAAGGMEEADGDASLVLARAVRAGRQGRTEEARALLDRAAELPVPSNFPWHRGDVVVIGLQLSWYAEGAFSLEEIAAAERAYPSPVHRRRLAALRFGILTTRGRFAEALSVAQDLERLLRSGGAPTTPAAVAWALAELGHTREATHLVDETIARLDRLHPAQRPHYSLAHALRALGRAERAVEHAVEHYRLVWADGPPHAIHWGLRDARALLDRLGAPEPALPVVDPATVTIPHEATLRALIAHRAESGPDR